MTRVCPGCQEAFEPRRRDQGTCSARCRKRVSRRATEGGGVDGAYVVTEEDREAMRKVLARDGHGHWLRDPVDAETVRRHAAATAIRTGELDE
jgi:hypothetical protein